MKLYRISHSSGLNIPFGTSVKDNEGQVVGLVGQGARVMLPQNNQTSRYSIEWQKDKSVHHCSLTISPVPESVKTPEGLSHQDVHCLSEGNKNEG
jgi:outer membrane usher protein